MATEKTVHRSRSVERSERGLPALPGALLDSDSSQVLAYREMKRAAIYARVSSTSQEEEGTSLLTQVEDCQAYCTQCGYLVRDGAIFQDVHTGSEYRERPGLTRLREAMRRKEIDVVVVWNIDRYTRSPVHLAVLIDEARYLGVSVEFVKEKFDDSPTGEFLRSALGYVGQIEREKIIERTLRGRMARAKAGKIIPSHKPLYGYQFNHDKSAYLVHPEEGRIVQRIFQMAVDGYPLRAIARKLDEEGIPSPGGKVWGQYIPHRILLERRYTGEGAAFCYQNVKRPGGRIEKRRRLEEQIMLPPGVFPQLVTMEMYERVQEQLRRNKEQAYRNNRHPELALLRGGFVRCGYCRNTMIVHVFGKQWPNKPCYQCRSNQRIRNQCSYHSIGVEVLDQAVWQRVIEVVQDPSLILRKIEGLRETDPTKEDLAPIERTLAKIKQEQKSLLSHLGDLDPVYTEAVQRQLNELAQKQRKLEQEKDLLFAIREDWEMVQEELEKFKEWCLGFAQRLGTHTYEEKRRACNFLGVEVKVWNTTHTPRYEITMSPDIVVRSTSR